MNHNNDYTYINLKLHVVVDYLLAISLTCLVWLLHTNVPLLYLLHTNAAFILLFFLLLFYSFPFSPLLFIHLTVDQLIIFIHDNKNKCFDSYQGDIMTTT